MEGTCQDSVSKDELDRIGNGLRYERPGREFKPQRQCPFSTARAPKNLKGRSQIEGHIDASHEEHR